MFYAVSRLVNLFCRTAQIEKVVYFLDFFDWVVYFLNFLP